MNRVSQPRTSRPAKRGQPGTDRRENLLVAGVIGTAAIVIGILVGVFNPLLNRAATVEGATVDILFSILLGVATVIFVIVEGGLIYSIGRFRHKGSYDDFDDDDEVVPFHGHLGLEVLWTAIPAVLVTAAALGSYFVLFVNEQPQANAIPVEVTARQFAWQFYYPSLDVTTTELHIPIGQQVDVKLHSLDVIHQFWIPQFRIKKDVMPDRVTELRFTGQQEGTYPIVCSKICGAGHSNMRANVVVETPDKFDAWIASQASSLAQVGGGAQDPLAQGRKVFGLNGCNACHTLKDASATGKVGPDLDGLGTRAAATIKSPDYHGKATDAAGYIHESVVDPNAYVVPGFQPNIMPGNFGTTISQNDLDALVQYLAAQK